MTAPFDALLEVQEHDTRLDQLRHRHESLPAREERDAARDALAAVERATAEQEAIRAELARSQRKLDDEIESTSTKRKQAEATLYGGSVTNARELQDIQEEVEALGRRITHLEDQDLEIMEQLEPVDVRLAELAQAREQRTNLLEESERRLTAAEAEILVAIDEAQAAREAVARSVPADLLEEYEKLRGGRGGIGVARLLGTQCGGCHLSLSAVEAARIRKLEPGEITHCEECGRLLVP